MKLLFSMVLFGSLFANAESIGTVFKPDSPITELSQKIILNSIQSYCPNIVSLKEISTSVDYLPTRWEGVSESFYHIDFNGQVNQSGRPALVELRVNYSIAWGVVIYAAPADLDICK